MALFGVDEKKDAPLRAVKSGLEMIEEMEKLSPYLRMLYNQSLRIGVGIHYGEAVIGTIGGTEKRKTIIGDSVNFASRIESANKKLGTQLLISQQVYDKVKDSVMVNQRVRMSIKGKTGRYTLYEVIGLDTSTD